MPHYFYIYNISSYDFTAIQTMKAEIYLFTMGTLYKIYSRILVLAFYGGGKLTVKCPSPETSRNLITIYNAAQIPTFELCADAYSTTASYVAFN